MGTFLDMGIIQECSKYKAENFLNEWIQNNNIKDIKIGEYSIKEQGEGVLVTFNDYAVESEQFFEYVSKNNDCCSMYLYIYDGDFWGYNLFLKGKEIDCFMPIPDYFEEVSEEERLKCSGNPEKVAECFKVDKKELEKFIIIWPEDEDNEYEEDEKSEWYFDEWAVTDFIKALGYKYEDEE